MSILDAFSNKASNPDPAEASTSAAVRGTNDIPPPRSDASVNAPPPAQHQRVIDFVRVSVCDQRTESY